MKILARLKKTIRTFIQKEPPPEYEVTQFVISDRQPITGASKISFFVNNPQPGASVTRTFENEDDVKRNWEQIKLKEKGKTSVLQGVPKSLSLIHI